MQRIDESVAAPPPTRVPESIGSFDEFYEREYRRVVAITFALAGSWQAAEDAAQDAFIAAHHRWDELVGFDLPAAWVTRVASNNAISMLRRRKSELKAIASMRQWRHKPVELDSADHEFWAEVRRLPPNQATAITLFYLDDRPVAEIAEVLDCAPSTARVHLHRGRKTLAAALDLEVSE